MPGDHWRSEGYADILLTEVCEEPIQSVFTVVKVNAIPDMVKARTVYPVELSLVSFSLEKGIVGVFTSLIDLERVSPGNAFNAKILSDETGLPLPGSCHLLVEHRDYNAIGEEIAKAVEKYDLPGFRKRRLLFAMCKDLEEAADAIKWLAHQCGTDENLQDRLLNIEFLDLSKLFYRIARFVSLSQKLYQPAMVQFNLVSTAEKQLNRSIRLNFRTEITCAYHCRVASQFMNKCAQNYCLQRIFTIFDELLGPLAIKRENGHCLSTFHLNIPLQEDDQTGFSENRISGSNIQEPKKEIL